MHQKRKKPIIAFLGSLPPPFGGNTVHLQRLLEKLEELGIDYTVYDLLNRKKTSSSAKNNNIRYYLLWLFMYFLTSKDDLICCYYVDWKIRVLVGLMSLRRKKTLLTVAGQNLQDSLDSSNWLKTKIIVFTLRRYSYIIAHNEKIRQLCLELGVNTERISIIPHFIPPTVKQEEIDQIPESVWKYIATHNPVITANAFRLRFYEGEDLYGLDLCVELCEKLHTDYPETGFVFCLPQIGESKYFETIKQVINEKGIEDNFLFVTEPFQFYPILMKSHLFLRPTNTDGDAVSLREALFFGVPSVASDVIPRPKGTIIFKNRDIDDLTRCVREILGNYTKYKAKCKTLELEDNVTPLIDVFQELVSHSD